MVGVGISESATERRPNLRVGLRLRYRNLSVVIGVQAPILSVFRSSLKPLPVLNRGVSFVARVIKLEYSRDVPVYVLLFRNPSVLTLIDSCYEVGVGFADSVTHPVAKTAKTIAATLCFLNDVVKYCKVLSQVLRGLSCKSSTRVKPDCSGIFSARAERPSRSSQGVTPGRTKARGTGQILTRQRVSQGA